MIIYIEEQRLEGVAKPRTGQVEGGM